ncbi:hypothetical protein EVJ58_g6180 [Rhodofomes roseus]|uniref:BTB domain-containing protein n=1 Tax=Rhodofomes roseus TaxID=34475 RepID=A0A4Y9Y9D8_9APHY|nr:hypothetical protein EVJ58_g6180 [Rhodofomes roseus]
MHSPVFRDMFKLPQSDTGKKSVSEFNPDNLDVVRMPDNGYQFIYFLKAIYERSFFQANKAVGFSDEIATSIIVLADKYDMQDLYREATHRLSGLPYSTTFAAFELRQACPHTTAQAAHSPRTRRVNITLEPFFLINAARRLQTRELLKMLPIAFYFATSMTAEALTDGVARKVLHKTLGEYGREVLDPEDARRCIEAKPKLVKASQDATRCFSLDTANLSPACAAKQRRSPCRVALERLSQAAAGADLANNTSPLKSREGWFDKRCTDAPMNKLCKDCQAHIKRLHKEAREKVWNDLKKLYDLEAWP